MIYLRKARLADLPAIMEIIQEARAFLAPSGTGQWQGEYPAEIHIKDFIEDEIGYVLVVDANVAGFCAIIEGEDEAYTKITEGTWSNDSFDYAAIHCIALSDNYRGQGLMSFLFSNVFSLCLAKGISDFRIDTHAENQSMRSAILREKFIYRGKVFLEGERDAFQLELR